MSEYGERPVSVGAFDLDWNELMHYLYLPVQMPSLGWSPLALPRRLGFLRGLVEAAIVDAGKYGERWTDADYVYVTARRGYATPDNPLNRPGWHCDGFGTDDLNYIWWDCHSTRFAEQSFARIDPDHAASMGQFDLQVWADAIRRYPDRTLYRLSPFVVHATPEIPKGGCMRSFVKVSFSRHRYNLEGNSHNYLFDYDWTMHPRSDARNDPHYAGADFIPEPVRVSP